MQFLDPRVPERFWEKCIPEPMSGCWLFIGRHDSKGYGTFDVGNTTRRSHRVPYETEHGAVPSGLELDHKCRTRCCVNPAHLEAVTHAVNMARAVIDPMKNSRAFRTHCPMGHAYTEENTAYRANAPTKQGRPVRRCRACNRANVKRARKRRQ